MKSFAEDDARAVSVTLTDQGRELAWKVVPSAELDERIAPEHMFT